MAVAQVGKGVFTFFNTIGMLVVALGNVRYQFYVEKDELIITTEDNVVIEPAVIDGKPGVRIRKRKE